MRAWKVAFGTLLGMSGEWVTGSMLDGYILLEVIYARLRSWRLHS